MLKNVSIRYRKRDLKVELWGPPQYWRLDGGEKQRICNGCGPAGALIDYVPDKCWGVPIHEACNIHDFMYHIGENTEDKDAADAMFLQNINKIIRACTKRKWLMTLRLHRAYMYYLAVSMYGGPAFWADKTKLT